MKRTETFVNRERRLAWTAPIMEAAASATPDSGRDVLNVLTLLMVPLETAALMGPHLIKNVRLRSVIEMFANQSAGGGRMEVGDLNPTFGWPDDAPTPNSPYCAG